MKIIHILPGDPGRIKFLGLEPFLNEKGYVVMDYIWCLWEVECQKLNDSGLNPVSLVLCSSQYELQIKHEKPEEIWSQWLWWIEQVNKGQWVDFCYITDRWAGGVSYVTRSDFSEISCREFLAILMKTRKFSHFKLVRV